MEQVNVLYAHMHSSYDEFRKYSIVLGEGCKLVKFKESWFFEDENGGNIHGLIEIVKSFGALEGVGLIVIDGTLNYINALATSDRGYLRKNIDAKILEIDPAVGSMNLSHKHRSDYTITPEKALKFTGAHYGIVCPYEKSHLAMAVDGIVTGKLPEHENYGLTHGDLGDKLFANPDFMGRSILD